MDEDSIGLALEQHWDNLLQRKLDREAEEEREEVENESEEQK